MLIARVKRISMEDIAHAFSLTDPLYETWESLGFEKKWGKKYVPSPLAKQNAGCIVGQDGIRGTLQLHYMKMKRKRRGVIGILERCYKKWKKKGDGVFIQLDCDGRNVSLKIAGIYQNDPLKMGEFHEVPINKFDKYIGSL
ncbi:MAG: hypothetical protein V3U72_00560 [Candidatus Aenigmarchaeota archaeon]